MGCRLRSDGGLLTSSPRECHGVGAWGERVPMGGARAAMGGGGGGGGARGGGGGGGGGRLGEAVQGTFEVVYMGGWRPDKSQQKPAARGSGTVSLADLDKELGPRPGQEGAS